jgi:hypothetical protein
MKRSHIFIKLVCLFPIKLKFAIHHQCPIPTCIKANWTNSDISFHSDLREGIFDPRYRPLGNGELNIIREFISWGQILPWPRHIDSMDESVESIGANNSLTI